MIKKPFFIFIGLIAIGALSYLAATQWVGLRVVKITPNTDTSTGPLARIGLTFDRVIDSTSIGPAFRISPDIHGKWEIDGQTAWFTPSQALKAGATYQLRLGAGVRALDGTRLTKPFSWSFTVREPWVTYLSPTYGTHQLWRVPATGGVPQLLSNVPGSVLEYSITPDGSQVAFSADNDQGGADIWLVDRDGGGQHKVIDCANELCRSPAWNPDKVTLAYVRVKAPATGTYPAGELWLYDKNTGKSAAIQRAEVVTGSEPVWSPDGTRLAFFDTSVDVIRVLSWKGDTEVRFQPSEPGPVSFSPDGKQVAYLNPALDGVIPYNQIVIYLFEQKTTQTIPADGGSIADYSLPNWSPSGDELVVGRHPPAGNPAQELWTMKLDGTPIEKILSDPSKNYVQYGWDPQGENLLIQAANLTNLKSSPEILLWDRMEKTPRILSNEGIWPAWLP